MQKKNIRAEREMSAHAEKLGRDAYSDARRNCEDEWRKLVGKDFPACPMPDFADRAIFNLASNHVLLLRGNLENDVCNPTAFIGEAELMDVLTYDFGFDYSEFEWNGRSLDPKDGDSFNIISCHAHVNVQNDKKREIATSFIQYIIEGAAKAKFIGSKAYELWRSALIDSVFEYGRFEEGLDRKTLLRLFDRLREAAKLTWADNEIDKQLKLSHLSPGCGKKRSGKTKKR